MKKNFLLAVLSLFAATLFAQNNNVSNYLLWKVSGNGLKKPSFLFGTFHLLSNSFVDTLSQVTDAYNSADAIEGELIIDSTIQATMMQASVLNGTTLHELLPDTLYKKTADWFKQEAGLDLKQLDMMNPLTVMTAAMAITQQKYFAHKPGEVQLDAYFQQAAKKDGKQVLGLETIHDQIKAMFGQLTLQRQIDLLAETFKKDNDIRSMIATMHKAYIAQNLNDLQQFMYGSSYKKQEMMLLLDDRNNKWMQQLPGLMQDKSLFVAVGALHFVGESGLVNQLQNKGYTVTPINVNKR